MPKIEDRYSDDKYERDYTRSWFRMWSRMTLRIKANRSSMFRGNMGCRHCDTGADENHEHLEACTGFSHEQRSLKMMKRGS